MRGLSGVLTSLARSDRRGERYWRERAHTVALDLLSSSRFRGDFNRDPQATFAVIYIFANFLVRENKEGLCIKW